MWLKVGPSATSPREVRLLVMYTVLSQLARVAGGRHRRRSLGCLLLVAGLSPAHAFFMSVQLNHTIVWCHDKNTSSAFLVELLGLKAPTPFGPMLVVELDNKVSLDFYNVKGEVT